MLKIDRCNRLLDSGFSLIPVAENKIPAVAWKKYQTQAPTKEEFEGLYNLPETKNVGIVTGFNNVEVIDIDLKVLPSLDQQQKFWAEFLSFLQDNIDEFDNKFVIYKTINNGYHILYRCAVIEGNKKLAKFEGQREAIIETRGVGGYVFAYQNKVGALDYSEIKEISPQEREALLACCRVYDYIEEPPKEAPPKKDYEPAEGLTPWEDYNARNSILDIVGDEIRVIRATDRHYLVKRDGATSPHSGYVYRNSGCMYLFSTGTRYPAEKLITPFMAYAIKHHAGDFSAAAKAIYSDGYGSRRKRKAEPVEVPKIKRTALTFPVEIFPPEVQEYLINSQKTLSLSLDYMGCSMLWLISLIVGNVFRLEVKTGWYEKGVIWLCLVGRAGVGKTPSISQVIGPLEKINNQEIKRFENEMQKFVAFDRLTKEEKTQTEEVKKPNRGQFIVNDITLEALVELHQNQKKALGVFKDELAGWFKDMNKYRQGSDFEFHLSSWSGKSVAMNRKTATSSFVQHPFIPVLGGIQPSILDKFSGEDFSESGFLDRLLISYPDLTIDKYNDDELNPELIAGHFDRMLAFHKIVEDLLEYDSEGEVIPTEIYLSKEAKAVWIKAYNDITAQQNSHDESEFFKSMLPKQKTYIPRFALLIHVFATASDQEPDLYEVSAESMRKAVKLSKYFINQAKRVKGETQESQTARDAFKGKLDPYEKFAAAYEANPNISKQKLADLLQVSRTTVYKYLRNYNEKT